MLPRLNEIADQPREGTVDPLVQRHVDDARQLTNALQFCIDKDVELLFG